MSALVDRAIEAAGLGDVVDARRAETLSAAYAARLRAADLLALGALADKVRADECGPDVFIYTSDLPPPEGLVGARSAGDGPLVVLPERGSALTGLELLREVAVARICGRRGTRLRVDWTACGLELAQVALGFGADELAGRISNKRGLPLGDGELLGVGKKSRHELAEVVKRKELAEVVRRAGRVPIFVGADGVREVVHPQTTAQETA
jgi:2-iminoacetate synthase ThiH